MAVIETIKDPVLTCLDIEVCVARHFDYRRNLIVPNVYWGLGFRHECDVLVMTDAGFLTEIEIKTSRADLKNDLKKIHGHRSDKIRRQFFAVPEKLVSTAQEILDTKWGILKVHGGFCETIRTARLNKNASALTPNEIAHLYKLAAMRTWTLKETLRNRIIRDRVPTPSDSGGGLV